MNRNRETSLPFWMTGSPLTSLTSSASSPRSSDDSVSKVEPAFSSMTSLSSWTRFRLGTSLSFSSVGVVTFSSYDIVASVKLLGWGAGIVYELVSSPSAGTYASVTAIFSLMRIVPEEGDIWCNCV